METVVLTFEPHPRKVLFPKDDLRLITSVDEKLELLDQYGVDVAVVYPFTKEFSQLDSGLYIDEILLRRLNVKFLVIGYDHRFGKDRRGDIGTLKEAALEKGFSIEEISAQDIDHIIISSSKIRKALEEGHVELASGFLGHYFFLNGQVVKGKQLGRTLGYPTANIKLTEKEKIVPATGVYLVEVIINSIAYYGMMNIGLNPTTDNDHSIKLEVHIFNFNSDIYFWFIKVNFLKRLRDELKFNDLNELKTALDRDKEQCYQLINTYAVK